MDSARPHLCWLLTVLVLSTTGCISQAVQRDTRDSPRLVVMPIAGNSELQEVLNQMVESRYEVLSSRRYRNSARDLQAKSRRPQDIRAVASELDISVLIHGQFSPANNDSYKLRIQLYEGDTGEVFDLLNFSVTSRDLTDQEFDQLESQLLSALSATQRSETLQTELVRGKSIPTDQSARERERARKLRKEFRERNETALDDSEEGDELSDAKRMEDEGLDDAHGDEEENVADEEGLEEFEPSAFLFKTQGEVGTETRAFFPDDNDLTEDLGAGTAARFQLDGRRKKTIRGRARLFARYDLFDPDRFSVIPEELFLEYKKDPWRVRVGLQTLNWSATEAFHPTDVINSRNFDSTFENQEKIGEPMISVRFKALGGSIEAHIIPYSLDPIFPSTVSRLQRTTPGIALGSPLRVDNQGGPIDRGGAIYGAFTFEKTYGSRDLALFAVKHVDRQNPLIAIDLATGTTRPVFQPFTMLGATSNKRERRFYSREKLPPYSTPQWILPWHSCPYQTGITSRLPSA